MKVVIDTNVLIAAARSRRGASFKLLSLIPDERFQVCVSSPLYFECLEVLTRAKHRPPGLSDDQITATVRYLLHDAHLQEIYFHWRPFLPDINDDMVLELAVASQAEAIVTFNVKDFRGIETFGITVFKPRELLVKIGELS